MTLAEAFERVSREYKVAKTELFREHELANFIRRDIPMALKALIGTVSTSYVIKGSAGQGAWSGSPWVAALDPTVTTSAEEGYYLVFLFGPEFKGFSLVLGQGTYSVRKEFGKKGPEVLQYRGEIMRLRVPEYSKHFQKGPFQVISSNHAGEDWTTASVWGKTYSFESKPSDDEMRSDILQMLKLYHLSTSRGGYEFDGKTEGDVPISAPASAVSPQDQFDGQRRIKHHKRIERQRNGKLAKDAKRIHGHICQGCGFDFFKVYGEKGSKYIDAHHLVPLSSLTEDGPVLLNLLKDFSVLCANCHRMIHRMGCPSLPDFKKSICGKYVELLVSY